jgi:pilus assembly protein CpaE
MKITAISRNQQLLQDLRLVLERTSGRAELEFINDTDLAAWGQDAARNMKAKLRAVGPEYQGEESAGDLQSAPDLLMLHKDSQDGNAWEDVERLTRRWPQMTLFLLSEDGSPSFLVRAMRAGVREVLAIPLVADDVLGAIDRARNRISENSGTEGRGKILGFVACKGGSGATFIAANVAYSLASDHHKRVLLIDLNLQYGDASFFFLSDQSPSGSVAEVVRQSERMDATLLAASSLRVLPNFSVLPAPEDPEEAASVKPDQIGRLLTLAAAHYDYVLFDIDRSIDAVSLSALDQADTIFAVMQSMVPDMRDARTLLRAFRRLGYPDSKLQFIVNRSDKKEDAPMKPIERGLGIEFYRTIPNDYFNASASVNQGISILKLAPASPVSKVLRDIAGDLVGVVNDQDHWFRRLLRRA